MNLLIENLNSALLSKIDINVIKTLQGEFTKRDLEDRLVNLYYSRVIIDITAIKNHEDFNSLFDFLYYFDKDKVVLLLEVDASAEYISAIVKEGYYNFTKNIGGINYLIDHPNTLRDVEKYIIVDIFDDNIKTDEKIIKKDVDKLIKNPNQIVIGIQNLTEHAGATTLMNMMLNALNPTYSAVGIEMVSHDTIFLRSSNIGESVSYDDLCYKIRTMKNMNVIIVDLNGVNAVNLCDYVLYLIEPGIISLSKLFSNKYNYEEAFANSNGKIILNRSSLTDDVIKGFEYNTKVKVFHVIGNLNDRDNNHMDINILLNKLGFDKIQNNMGLFGLLRK